jgi:tripartite-type tricarboxylate transporter receptor subunit TctC
VKHLDAFLLLLFSALVMVGGIAEAQPFPQRPVQLVIPNVPGSIIDINARILSDEIGRIIGIQLVPINKPGAAMTLGTDLVARSKKDGYTIGYVGSTSIVYSRILNPETVPYDPNKDLAPLGLHLFNVLGVNVQAESPWKTFAELIDFAKKNPGKLRVGTMGVGSIDHLNLEIVQSITSTQFTHVPFKGGESTTSALLGGHVEVTFDAFSKSIPFVESGKMRILLTSRKMVGYPQIPVAAEFGYRERLLTGWFAFYGPSGMPEEATKALIHAIEKAVKNPELKAKVEKMGYDVEYKSPSEVEKQAREDYETTNKLAEKLGLRK